MELTFQKEINNLIFRIAIIGLLVCQIGCTFRNEEDLFADELCVTTDVTYSTFVRPLIDNQCVSCHNSTLPSGNVNLENYEELSVYVNNGQFFGAVSHDPGFSPMPQDGPRLADCSIKKIESWIDKGFPNN